MLAWGAKRDTFETLKICFIFCIFWNEGPCLCRGPLIVFLRVSHLGVSLVLAHTCTAVFGDRQDGLALPLSGPSSGPHSARPGAMLISPGPARQGRYRHNLSATEPRQSSGWAERGGLADANTTHTEHTHTHTHTQSHPPTLSCSLSAGADSHLTANPDHGHMTQFHRHTASLQPQPEIG